MRVHKFKKLHISFSKSPVLFLNLQNNNNNLISTLLFNNRTKLPLSSINYTTMYDC